MNSTCAKFASGEQLETLTKIAELTAMVNELTDAFNRQAKFTEATIVSMIIYNHTAEIHMNRYGCEEPIDLEYKNTEWTSKNEEHYEFDENGVKFFVLKTKEQEDELS